MDYKIIAERDIIWLAGLIDGEGSIFVKRTAGTKNPIHSLDVEISMTDKPTIEKIHTMLGFGSFRPARRKKKLAHHKQAWKWVATSRDAEVVLNLITPYLMTKRDEAIMGLRFCELKRDRVGRAGLSDEMVAEREWYYQELKLLKKREWEI